MTPEPLTRTLRAHKLFEGIPDEQVEAAAGCASNVAFRAGDLIVRDGEEATATYLVREGTIALEVHQPGLGPRRLGDVEPGEILGWSWLYPPYRWAFHARAVTDVRATRLDGVCLRARCERDPAFGYALLKRILFQVHRRLEETRLVALDLYGAPSEVTP